MPIVLERTNFASMKLQKIVSEGENYTEPVIARQNVNENEMKDVSRKGGSIEELEARNKGPLHESNTFVAALADYKVADKIFEREAERINAVQPHCFDGAFCVERKLWNV